MKVNEDLIYKWSKYNCNHYLWSGEASVGRYDLSEAYENEDVKHIDTDTNISV